MSPLLWLAVAAGFGVAAWLAGWPAWTGYRARQTRDLNAERYLAWRGRAPRPGAQPSLREGMTAEERRRLWGAGVLGLAALACLVAFFVTT